MPLHASVLVCAWMGMVFTLCIMPNASCCLDEALPSLLVMRTLCLHSSQEIGIQSLKLSILQVICNGTGVEVCNNKTFFLL